MFGWSIDFFLLGVRVLHLAAFSSMIIFTTEGTRATSGNIFLISYLFLLATSGSSSSIEHKVRPIASINQQITTPV